MLDQASQIGALLVDKDFKTIEELDVLVKLRLDVIIDPTSALITKISPFEMKEGLTEREAISELIKLHTQHEATHFIGFNNHRYDAQVLHHATYRNLVSPTPDKVGNNQLDVYHLVQLVYALRGQSMNFPLENDKPKLKLETLCLANNIKLTAAHNASADIQATIELLKLMKGIEPALYQYWLALSLPNNIDALCRNNSWLLMTNSAFGNKTRYTRPVAPVIQTPFGYYALDLTLDFNTEEKHLFQKVNKFQSPLLTEVTEAQGDRLLMNLSLEPQELHNALLKLEQTDTQQLFDEWQSKHPKREYEPATEPFLLGFDKFNVDEKADISVIQNCTIDDIEPQLLSSPRVKALANRLVSFQSQSASAVLGLSNEAMLDIAQYLRGKLPENNKTTKERIESIDTLMAEATNEQDRQILSNLKFTALHQIQVWKTIIESVTIQTNANYSVTLNTTDPISNEAKQEALMDTRSWLEQLFL